MPFQTDAKNKALQREIKDTSVKAWGLDLQSSVSPQGHDVSASSTQTTWERFLMLSLKQRLMSLRLVSNV